MKFDELCRSPVAGFLQLERYANDESPSGFTISRTALPTEFHPLGHQSDFELPIFGLPRVSGVQIGEVRDVLWTRPILDADELPCPIHPVVLEEITGKFALLANSQPRLRVRASPTSSGRTVWVPAETETMGVFIKLHFPRVLGRFERGIPLYKWIAASESARLLATHRDVLMPRVDYFYDFVQLFFFEGSGSSGFGTFFRRFPASFEPEGGRALIPSFSLFSRDRRQPEDPPLLWQILDRRRHSIETLMGELIAPLIESYVEMATNLGLIPEWNAQNLVLELDADGCLRRVCLRDMESLWKDLTVRRAQNLPADFATYHTLRRESDSDYFERRSFLFDFKFGEYVLRPICLSASQRLGVPPQSVLQAARDIGKAAWAAHPDYFSSADLWFRYQAAMEVSRETYEACRDPSFR